ncbi:hypothetical protein [Spiroplasma litorale]|uniref:hypothetical protein n=1 Tax=Spiroplasma litorale TaxID=216942 RepID=UPI001F3D4210|nr:hypothetical protein [Spiroplasma litorale]
MLFILLLSIIVIFYVKSIKNKIYYNENIDKDFIFKKTIQRKWWVSKKGKIENFWNITQNKKVDLKLLGIKEYFNKNFCNSNYLFVWRKLYKNFGYKVAQNIVNKLKNYNNIIENLWFKFYKPKLNNRLKKLKLNLQSPEYFFYKYYFLFIYKSRELIVNQIITNILPAILKEELTKETLNEYEEFINIKNIDPDYCIKNAYLSIKKDLLLLFERINYECDLEISNKGKEYAIDYSNINIIFDIIPIEHLSKIIFNQKFIKLAKKFKINMSESKKQDIEELIDKLKINKIDYDEKLLNKYIK